MPNANAIDGNRSGAFFHRQSTDQQYTSSCATQGRWDACAPADLAVSSGQVCYLTVISSVTAKAPAPGADVLLCPAYTGLSCFTGIPARMSFLSGQWNNWASSATRSFSPGTYTSNTAMKWPFGIPANTEGLTSTTVLAYDYRQQYLTGP